MRVSAAADIVGGWVIPWIIPSVVGRHACVLSYGDPGRVMGGGHGSSPHAVNCLWNVCKSIYYLALYQIHSSFIKALCFDSFFVSVWS